ncbi:MULTISPECIES: ribosome small subunit-dependent GTPase A [unclassified Isoptericola]|uniref:ribosome small subunit-dependent GTPase A n=1 Tax=unclassified Isoptericola TaxID=2623355 RepID=UPI0027134ADA|nr:MULTISPECIES: ribosome small subunit-dependent GTPase A [unclassified Isoptericola]MDO8144182.1 ribosome small subunit-dependent GTPase A [Isoptericola sp. 178]MDO8148036.1 ribosome small subunit-dependent GTPase A [Isoptericola sp. b515]MDO8151511.1 ribosome small subunit-dependent GTPase A [Isoptericola sp. b408]
MARARDEHDRFSRPSKHGSRPRSKQRPEHANAVPAMVTGIDRGRYTLVVDDGGPDEREILAMKARELGRTRTVVGDRVDVVGDTSGREGTLARIVRITDRTSTLRRTADDTDPYERIVVANADQLVVVTALAQPEPRTGMIDRCVVAAYDAGMDVLLCLTKADLASPDELRDLYEPIGVDVVVTRRDDAESVETVRERLLGRTSVLVGHSGVGKSTLINALVPDALRATGVVNDVTGRGRHTSTSAVALRLPVGPGSSVDGEGHDGWVIDTPGVRSFGLAHVEPEHLLRAFEDLDAAAEECPRGCTHLADAPDCALDEWVEAAEDGDGRAARAARLASFRRLLTSRTDAG